MKPQNIEHGFWDIAIPMLICLGILIYFTVIYKEKPTSEAREEFDEKDIYS